MKLYESLFILNKCAINIDTSFNEMMEILNGPAYTWQDSITFKLLCNYLILEANSYEKEYTHHLLKQSEQALKQKVEELNFILSPILAKANWQSLWKYRSQMIAHNWRDEKGNFVNPDINAFDVPQSPTEYIFLYHCIRYIHTIIVNEFSEEFPLALEYITNLKANSIKASNTEGKNIEFSAMEKEVNKRLSDLRRPYKLQVIPYEFE